MGKRPVPKTRSEPRAASSVTDEILTNFTPEQRRRIINWWESKAHPDLNGEGYTPPNVAADLDGYEVRSLSGRISLVCTECETIISLTGEPKDDLGQLARRALNHECLPSVPTNSQ